MQEINDWLSDLGLQQYGPAFARHAITPELLEKLHDADLKELGVSMLGHRIRLLAALDSLRKTAGTPLPSTATAANAVNEVLVPKAERRQITILFCDLVGSTQMASTLDPEDVRHVMETYHGACRSAIESYGGNVAQFLGDGVMAYYGWPIAHENDAERALRSALDIVAKMKTIRRQDSPLQVRIGVASGAVVIGKGHDEHDISLLAVGETPNLAARLQTLAEADQILIAPLTHKLAKSLFQYSDMGLHQLKGIQTPVQVWRLEGDVGSPSRFDGRSPGNAAFVGRETEAAHLKQLWQQTLQGKGQVAVLQGEPGIGKSRTANQLEEHLSNQAHVCLHLHASPFHINSAFHPIIVHLLHAMDIADSDTEAEKLAKVSKLMQEDGETSLQAVGLIASLLGLRVTGADPGAGMTSAQKKAQTIHYLCAMIVYLSERRPVLMVIEDMHWLDASTFEVIEALMLLARSKRIMLLATSRSEPPPQWAGKPQLTLLRLGRLSEAETRQLVEAITHDNSLPAELMQSIASMTDGVPLFIEELTKSLLESEMFRPCAAGQDFSVTKPMLKVPLTLRDSLMARLDRLAYGRDVAQIASCIGREFDFRLLAIISPFKGEALDSALGHLQLAGLVVHKKIAQKDVYVFKHAMVQEIAYESLLKSLRLQLHSRIAAAMETDFPEYAASQPELLAHHFAAADLPQKAMAYWQRAGALSLQRMAVQEAITHFDAALLQLQCLPPSLSRDASELELRTSLGTAWMAFRGWAAPPIAIHMGRAWELAQALGGDNYSLRIIWGMWVQLYCTGRLRDALPWATLLLAEAKRTGDSDMDIAGRMAACVSHYYLGEYHDSLRYADTLLDGYNAETQAHFADLINHDPKTIGGVQKAFCLWMLGKPESAVEVMHNTLKHAHARGHPVDTCYTVHCAGALAGQIGDAEEYALRVEELKRFGNELRLPFFEQIMAGISRASLLLITHQPTEAKMEFERIMPHFMATGMGISLTRYLTLSALSHGQAGEVGVAFEALEQVFSQIERPGWEEQYYFPEALRIKGELYRLSGKPSEAEAGFMAAIEAARNQHARSWELRAAVSLASLLSQQGRTEEASGWLAPVFGQFDEGFDMPDLQEAASLLNDLRNSNVMQISKRQTN
jgi:class 3 adenylate cyclase/tetratricopeptide (TPR) repeat protein